MKTMSAVVFIMSAFLVGGIPTKRVIARIWHVDLGSVGTGNAGAGNATRSIGLGAGLAMAVMDGFKGLIPILLARSIGLPVPVLVLIGFAAVAGNDWPIHLGQRGGRGLATSVGVLVGIDPLLVWWPAVWSAIGWRIGGGIAGFFGWGLLPVVTLAAGAPGTTVILSAGLAVTMIVRRAQGNDGFDPGAATARVLFDRDRAPTPAAPRLVLVGGMLVVVYGAGAWWLMSWLERPDVGIIGLALLAGGVACEFGAKWAFGGLFNEGLTTAGTPIPARSTFRAALVGSGVARLIPAGGAITPVAMSWSVRDEAPRAAGAAIRATVLSYGGLVAATGGGLLWVASRFPDTPVRTQTAVVAVATTLAGFVLVAGAGRLTRLARLVPRRWRPRLDAALQDHSISRLTLRLLLLRVGLEAAALWLTLAAFGISLSPSRTLAVFGVSQLVGGLPGPPGGIGFTEAGLFGALAFFGIQSAGAAIIAFRVISYWLPAVAGMSAGGYHFLRLRSTESR